MHLFSVYRRMATRLAARRTFRAWQVHQFCSKDARLSDSLKLTETKRIPTIGCPNHVLVRVKAASINPIDLYQMRGYGSSAFAVARDVGNYAMSGSMPSTEFPLVPGRDFAGEVVDSGPEAAKRGITAGAQVLGATLPHMSSESAGAMSEYVLVPQSFLALSPKLPAEEAVCFAYAGLTAWAAMSEGLGLNPRCQYPTKCVLVTAATGGVGYLLAQMLKNCAVANLHVTIPEDEASRAMMEQVGVDRMFRRPEKVDSFCKYDGIVDCLRSENLGAVNDDYLYSLKDDCGTRYVNLNAPLLENIDADGVVFGGLKTAKHLACQNIQLKQKRPGGQVRWAFFTPSAERLAQITRWAEEGKLHAKIHKRFPFSQLPDAYDAFAQGGIRGKVIVYFD